MANWWEPEEIIGEFWDRLVGDRASYTSYEEAAVTFDSIANYLPILFRTVGGDKTVKFSPSGASVEKHRLGLIQRLGMPQEAVNVSRATSEQINLPIQIDYFPDKKLNRDLYVWLALFFSSADKYQAVPDDPLIRDLVFIRHSYKTTVRAMNRFKGFAKRLDKLNEAMLEARLERKLSKEERDIELLILTLLGKQNTGIKEGHVFYDFVVSDGELPDGLKAPTNYLPTLAVPLWGEICPNRPPEHHNRDDNDELAPPSPDEEQEEQTAKKKARRKKFDEAERNDPLILYPFEGLMTWANMLNIARTVEDDDEENAKRAAEEADEIILTPNKKRAATKIKVNLDLAENAIETGSILGETLYPEWDYRLNDYHPDFCNIIAELAEEEAIATGHTEEIQRMINRVRRQFESLRPKRELLRRQLDGSELDMDAVITARCDLAASGKASDNIYMSTRDQARDLSVAILVDTSLSTDAWIENHRVLDVEKETLAVMAYGLEACGDRFALYSFTSKKRDNVRVSIIKDFEERMSEKVDRRVTALKPGHYTRIGSAIRHVTAELDKQPTRHRLLLIVTDGKPNDIDHYEGKYGIEDTRMSIREARRKGQVVYGVTIDKQAQDYFPHMFGKGSYSIVSHLSKLPAALPAIYRSVTS